MTGSRLDAFPKLSKRSFFKSVVGEFFKEKTCFLYINVFEGDNLQRIHLQTSRYVETGLKLLISNVFFIEIRVTEHNKIFKSYYDNLLLRC